MFKNKNVVIHTIASLLIGQITFWLLFLHRNELPPIVPLWFMQKDSVLVMAQVHYVWLLPGLSIGFLAVYLIITVFIHRYQPYIVNVIMSASTLGALFFLCATIQILGRVLGWL